VALQRQAGPGAPSRPPGAAGWLRRGARRWLEHLFPAPCTGCGGRLSGAPNPWFCAPCWEALPVLADGAAVCARCGEPFAVPDPRLAKRRCGSCLRAAGHFDLARSLGPYDEPLAEAVRLLKYRHQTGLARALAERAATGGMEPELMAVDVVVPVPLHPRRLRARGYNQSGWLARHLAPAVGAPLDLTALVRAVWTVPQVGLTRPQRAANVKGAFRVTEPGRVAGRAVLLVDDVFTTGATAEACARALKDAGATRVHVWTVARQGVEKAPERPRNGDGAAPDGSPGRGDGKEALIGED